MFVILQKIKCFRFTLKFFQRASLIQIAVSASEIAVAVVCPSSSARYAAEVDVVIAWLP